jgi:hypothetical protein
MKGNECAAKCGGYWYQISNGQILCIFRDNRKETMIDGVKLTLAQKIEDIQDCKLKKWEPVLDNTVR